MLGIAVAPDPPGELGQHPHRAHVERIGLQVALEQGLGIGQAIVAERQSGIDQRLGVMAGGQGDGGHLQIVLA